MKLTEEQKEEIKKLREEGMSVINIAKKFGVHRMTIYYTVDDKRRKKHWQSEKYREYQRKYQKSDKYKETRRKYYQRKKKEKENKS